MKFLPYAAFCAILLCPALHSQSALTLSTADVKFLSGCGVRQDDINVIPNLPSAGQGKILAILRKDGSGCNDFKDFKDSRDFLRKYTPRPSDLPSSPAGFDRDFFTSAESDYVNDVNMGILAQKVLESLNRQGKGLNDLFDESAPTLSADDVKFLDGCGVRQDDINVIPNLPPAGQTKITAILRKDGRECGDIKAYKDSRDFLRKYTPAPSKAPKAPKGYDTDFLTKAEYDYVSKVNKDILDL
ncbi:MAG: hypothetical protein WCA89_00100 [Terracidiphilus sp.]|jgi:hypothetical protein